MATLFNVSTNSESLVAARYREISICGAGMDFAQSLLLAHACSRARPSLPLTSPPTCAPADAPTHQQHTHAGEQQLPSAMSTPS